jgi:hypothetical protein
MIKESYNINESRERKLADHVLAPFPSEEELWCEQKQMEELLYWELYEQEMAAKENESGNEQNLNNNLKH